MQEILDDIDRWQASGQRGGARPRRRRRGLGPRDPGRGHGRQRGRRGRRVGVGRLRRGRRRHRGAGGARRRADRGSSRSATATTRRSPSASRAAAPSTCSSNRSTGRPSARSTRSCARRSRGRAAGRAGHGDRRPAPRAPSCSSRPEATPLGHARRRRLDRVVGPRRARRARVAGRTGVRHYGEQGQAERRPRCSVFVESFAPPPQMLDLRRGRLHRRARPGGQGPRLPGHGVRRPRGVRHPAPVPDGRRGRRRLAEPRCSTASAPSLGPRDAVCVLTHDPKFDVPAIARRARRAESGYIGVMGVAQDPRQAARAPRRGGRRHRRASTPASCPRSGSTSALASPEETAVSICAEIIALRTGRTPPSLRDRSGPIH